MSRTTTEGVCTGEYTPTSMVPAAHRGRTERRIFRGGRYVRVGTEREQVAKALGLSDEDIRLMQAAREAPGLLIVLADGRARV